MKCKKFKWVADIGMVILGGVLIISSIGKMHQPYDFLSNVYEYEILGPKAGLLLSIILPWLELLVGICIAGQILTKGALVLATILMLVFIIAQFSAIHKGLLISCGCFGTSDLKPISYVTLLRTFILFVATIVLFVTNMTSRDGFNE